MAEKQVSVILNVTDTSRNKRQKAITNINPLATDSDIYQFAQAVNALTVDTLDEITKVEKTQLEQANYYLACSENIYVSYQSPGAIAEFSIVDSTGRMVSYEDFVFTYGDYDNTKLNFTEETNTVNNTLTIVSRANEAMTVPVTVSAGEPYNLSKVIKVTNIQYGN